MSGVTPATAFAAYCDLFATLGASDLARFDVVYAPGARFKDPFNDVRGVPAIRAVFAHMYAAVRAPHFEILERGLDGDVGLVRWRFHYAERRGATRSFEGVSRVSFDAHGRVTEHLDYWDPVEAIWTRVPVLGAVLRVLGRRLAAAAVEP
jgi:steroid delta-isomerase